MKNVIGIISLLVSVCVLSSACINDEKQKPVNYTVNGKVEKGPFVNGSTIDMQPMNNNMQAIGSMFSSVISDNSGSFTFGSKEFNTSFAQLTATGYFFNEVTGKLSNGTLALRSVVSLADQSTVNVNILTHLKYPRVLNLMSQGKSFSQANAQAQTELLTAFGLQRFADTDVSQYTITAGSNEAGALIAISSLLLIDRSEAQLTEYMARLSEEFGSSGTFSENSKSMFKQDRNKLRNLLTTINKNIVDRYKELGTTVSVKDLSYFFDWNDDGVAGNEIADSDNPVTLDKTMLEVPREGGSYSITLQSSIPITLESANSSGISTPETFLLYKMSPIILTKALTAQSLNIVVQPASSGIMETAPVNIYDYTGKIVACLTVEQEGIVTTDIFTSQGEAILTDMMTKLSQALGLSIQIDASYTGQIKENSFKAPVSSESAILYQCWDYFYSAISRATIAYQADEVSRIKRLESPLKTLNALSYYKMISIWGDVPHRTVMNTTEFDLARTPASTIFTSAVTDLQAAINELGNKKNVFATNIADFMFFSKDVPRVVLAQIYMYQGKHNEARDVLKAVENGGFYQLEPALEYTSSHKELILGMNIVDGTRGSSTIIPVLTYSDVLLSLAECELKLGNTSAARNYLNMVTMMKGLSVSADVNTGIKEARNAVLSACGEYFAYLKRNGLAKSELGLADYQLLLPIPRQQLVMSPSLRQNPGY